MGSKYSKVDQRKFRNGQEMQKNEFLKYLVTHLSPHKMNKLDDAALNILNKQTGLSCEKINQIYEAFMRHNADGKLDKSQFIK